MLKILILTSSYRKKGNTASVAGLLEEILVSICKERNLKVQTETVLLARRNIQPCRGCRACFDRGEEKCPLKDDVPEIKKKLAKADILICSSPVYVEDVNGVMKNWIDRMSFVCHRPEYAGRSAHIISTSAAGSTKHTLKTMMMALRSWGYHITGMDTFITGGPVMIHEEISSKYQKKITALAETILSSYLKGKHLSPDMVSLLTFRIQQSYFRDNDTGSLDYQYWHSRGWLKHSCVWYTDDKVNRIRSVLAGVFASLMIKLVLK